MTSYVQAREAVVTALENIWGGAYPGVQVFYDNAVLVDPDKLTEFLGCEIEFMDSNQASVGVEPLMRTHGSATFCIAVRVGSGSKIALSRADFLVAALKFKRLGGVQFQAPHPIPSRKAKGWYTVELIIPFYFDT